MYIYIYISENYNTVSFHSFKSQNFKLSVSNPKSKYVAYVSVPSQISNCQGLGRKNKHEFLKTDRNTITQKYDEKVRECVYMIYVYICIRPVHLLRVSLLRVLESNFPGDSL